MYIILKMEPVNCIVIGSGPAGYNCSMYLSRAGLNPILFEGSDHAGGLLITTKIVENFLGFPEGIDGYELSERFRKQSEQFGTRVISESVISITKDGSIITVETDNKKYQAKAVIICTGSNPKHLSVVGYDKFWNHGISSCAVCDGALPCYRNVPIAVVGGGNSACEFALTLSRTAKLVYLIHRGTTLSKASNIMREKVLKNPKIIPIYNTFITEIGGQDHIEWIQTNNERLVVSGLFVAIGHLPNTDFLKGSLVALDHLGHIIVNQKKETTVQGIYAAGDVEDKIYKQAITAAGSGCIAALEVEQYLERNF